MAQAADLQDPPVPTPDTLGNADDVLSQLAGNEIDRLLAEAENAPDSATETAAPPPKPTQSKSAPKPPQAPSAETELGLDEATLTNQLDELFDQLQQDTSPKPPAPLDPPAAQAAASETPAGEAEEKAALLEAAGFEGKAKTPEPPAAGAAAPAAEAKAAASAGPAPAPVETSDSEKSAVLSAAGFENVGSPNAPLPIWLKPLEWINAPLNHASPAVRQAMGRAAIVTLVNAVLVLSYLAFTHKH